MEILHDLPYGYTGKILSVDLGEEKARVETLERRLADLFFGGRGLGIASLMAHFSRLQAEGKYGNAFAEADALSPDNVLIFSTSPATGTKVPTSSRLHLNFKSPLTGGLGSSNSGGRWGVDLKRAGYDVLIIRGRAKRPVYLVVSREGIELRSADGLQDLDTREITEKLSLELPGDARIVTVGQAGRNLARFASVINERGRAFGRGGGGAVFGSKNLYAVAVVPDRDGEVRVADSESLDAGQRQGAAFKAKLKLDMGKMTRREKNFGFLSSMGSLGLAGMVCHFDQLIHDNMRDTRHRAEDIGRISGEALRSHERNAGPGQERIRVRKGTCFNCPIACKRRTQILDEGGGVLAQGEGPEFETVALLGANLSIYDLTVIVRANYEANRYGLDTISLGSTIASFVELYGLVKSGEGNLTAGERQFREDVEEFVREHGEPAFGRPDFLLPLIRWIGQARGIGKYLASGSYRFCM
ncbi:MAG TPA: aldehyde ferredoxin oxidoreductase N-terminal domain-containing protein, partial [Spirochaetia bacterium]|nr:aldehyde ferredoxin oxidoreductase N-terminal domain-containing protein [Spirochaetia bacterium]